MPDERGYFGITNMSINFGFKNVYISIKSELNYASTNTKQIY